jgi:hypothetical protein
MTSIIRLEWERDPAGYVTRQSEDGKQYLHNKSRNGKLERYSLEGTGNRVFLEFVNTPCTPQGVAAFVSKWGLLVSDRQARDVEHICKLIEAGRGAAAWLNEDEPMAEIVRLGGPRIPLVLRIRRVEGEAKPRMVLDATNLFGFCFAELFQMLEGGTEIRKCLKCGTLFTLGKVGQRASYCSDKCRVAMHRRRQREAQQRASVKLRHNAGR